MNLQINFIKSYNMQIFNAYLCARNDSGLMREIAFGVWFKELEG